MTGVLDFIEYPSQVIAHYAHTTQIYATNQYNQPNHSCKIGFGSAGEFLNERYQSNEGTGKSCAGTYPRQAK
jgi:hypothetical protein